MVTTSTENSKWFKRFSQLVIVAATVPMMALAADPLVATGATPSSPANSSAASSIIAHRIAPLASSVANHFVWTVTAASQDGSCSEINNGATNGAAKALVFAQPVYNPGGIPATGTPSTVPVGVYYDTVTSEWCIFSEADTAPPALGTAFNVLVIPHATSTAFRVTATSNSIKGNTMFMSKVATTSHPNAVLLVQNIDVKTPFVNHPLGVAYKPSPGKWGIFQTDGGTMPTGATFEVLVGSASSGGTSIIKTSTSSNSKNGALYIKSPATNGSPNSEVFATENFDPHGVGGLHTGFNNVVQMVAWYDATDGWASIFNSDSSNLLVGSSYNLLLFGN